MKRFVELKDLYFGKKMHAKALQLLKEYVSPFSTFQTHRKFCTGSVKGRLI